MKTALRTPGERARARDPEPLEAMEGAGTQMRTGREVSGHGWRSQFVSAMLPLDPLAPDGGRSTVKT